MPRILVNLAAAAAAAPFAAHAQSIDRVHESEAKAPPGYYFEFGLSASELAASRTLEVYSAADRDVPNDGVQFQRIFSARLSGTMEGAPLYTDSKKCPALYGVLEEVSDQAAVQISLAILYGVRPEGAGYRAPPGSAPDGGAVTLWGRARQTTREPARMVVQSYGGRLAELSEYARVALEPCWQSEPPAMP